MAHLTACELAALVASECTSLDPASCSALCLSWPASAPLPRTQVEEQAAAEGGDPPVLDPVADLKLNSLGGCRHRPPDRHTGHWSEVHTTCLPLLPVDRLCAAAASQTASNPSMLHSPGTPLQTSRETSGCGLPLHSSLLDP